MAQGTACPRLLAASHGIASIGILAPPLSQLQRYRHTLLGAQPTPPHFLASLGEFAPFSSSTVLSVKRLFILHKNVSISEVHTVYQCSAGCWSTAERNTCHLEAVIVARRNEFCGSEL